MQNQPSVAQRQEGSPATTPRIALVLSGGGARAAYQVGVLQAIVEILPDPTRNPFAIICGTSAGAINAATLACEAQNFRAGVESLLDVWRNVRVDQVYHSDLRGIVGTGTRWLGKLALGWIVRSNPRSLLDNAPLAEMLAQRLDFSAIDRAIADGCLYAASITASGYTSGQSVSFFQARSEVPAWQRAQRMGSRVRLGVEHLMASAAIPFVFPAVRIHREYFGDGSMRQVAPISPAIHLGAERVLIIGNGRMQEPQVRQRQATYPSLAQIAGHAMSAIFLDTLAVDIERMERINATLGRLSEETREASGIPLRTIKSLVIAPSERLDHLAARHARSLPWTVRLLLSGIGAMNRQGGALTSYLLFEQPYTRALIDLGYRDTKARAADLRDLLGLSEPVSTAATLAEMGP